MDELRLLEHIISGCDESLKEAFLRRMDAATALARSKLQTDTPLYDAEREEESLRRICSGLSPDLTMKARSLWQTLMRMNRGRQYRYFVENDTDLKLRHEPHLMDVLPDGIALCPENMVFHTAAALDLEIKPSPSIQTCIDAVASGEEAYAAVTVSSLYDTEWLYSMLLDTPLYVNSITPTRQGPLVVLLSTRLSRGPFSDPVTSIAFNIEAQQQGTIAQALSMLSDNKLNVEFMRLTKRNYERDTIFLDFSGDLLAAEVRSALLQMQTELPYFQLIGFREAVNS